MAAGRSMVDGVEVVVEVMEESCGSWEIHG